MLEASILDDSGVERLIEAIIVQAAKDYIKCLKKFWKGDVGRNQLDSLEKYFKDMGLMGIRDACYKQTKKEYDSDKKRAKYIKRTN